MFREMRRFKQVLSQEECIEVLKNEPRGVLSLIGEDGYPYGIPMDHWYCEEDGKLYFHCAKEGHKEGEWALNIRSVVVFGQISVVEEAEKTKYICTNLCRKFTDDAAYLEHELTHSLVRVLCLELSPEHMTGKLVNES